jgi:hypothetical protein
MSDTKLNVMKLPAVLMTAFMIGVLGYILGLFLMVPGGSDQGMVIAMAMLLAPVFGTVALLIALASIKLAKQSAAFALVFATVFGLASAPFLKSLLNLSDARNSKAAMEERVERNKRELDMFWSEGFPKLQGFESGAPYQLHDKALATLRGALPVDETCEQVKAQLGEEWDEIRLSDSCHFGRLRGADAETIQVSEGAGEGSRKVQTYVTFRNSTQTQLAYRQLNTIVRAFKEQRWDDLEKLQTRMMLKSGGLRKVFENHVPEESSYDDGRMWADTPGDTQWLAMRVTIDREETRMSSGIEISPSLPPEKVPVIVLTLRTDMGLWRVERADIMTTGEYNEKLRL